MKTIVSTSLISFLLLSIVLGVFGFFFANSMMSGLQTPADILDDAVLYLRVYFVGFPFLFMYNILSTMFTSIGESKIPLGLLIFSSILNILMDLWMVAGLGLGVFGAAIATLIAQGISAVLHGCSNIKVPLTGLNGRNCIPCFTLRCRRFYSSPQCPSV